MSTSSSTYSQSGLVLAKMEKSEPIAHYRSPSKKQKSEPVQVISDEPPVPVVPPASKLTEDQKYQLTFYLDGTLKSIAAVEDGVRNGWMKYFRPDKSLYFETTYVKGTENGTRSIFAVDGRVIAQAQIFNGEALPPTDPQTDLIWWKTEIKSMFGDGWRKILSVFIRG